VTEIASHGVVFTAWWQIRGVEGIRGDAIHYSIQQLADSTHPSPEFESLSLRQLRISRHLLPSQKR